ncbi:hypothetical protein [Martelella endophytica]|nr:hypothetical protein [Martelella endophytica]
MLNVSSPGGASVALTADDLGAIRKALEQIDIVGEHYNAHGQARINR